MPHIVIKGPLTPEDIWLAFEPTEFREKGITYKAEEALLASDRQSLLIRSLTAERGFVKNFFVRIAQKENGTITIGLEKLNRPEISPGVQRLLGLYAWKILQIEVDASISGTNIPEFVGDYDPT